MGEIKMLESIYGNVPDILSQLIRTMLVPKEGCEFIVADFSAIEARVLAWLAGEQWRLDAFRNGEDIYCASASQMFGVPVVKHGINGELRQKGKVCGAGLWLSRRFRGTHFHGRVIHGIEGGRTSGHHRAVACRFSPHRTVSGGIWRRLRWTRSRPMRNMPPVGSASSTTVGRFGWRFRAAGSSPI